MQKNNRRVYEAAPSTRDSRGPALKREKEGIAAVSLPKESTQRPFVVNGLKSTLVKLFGDIRFSGKNFFEKRIDFLNEILTCFAYVDMAEVEAYPHALNSYDKMILTGFIITLGYHQADGLEAWRPSIVKFLRECGFEEVMLDGMIGFGVDLQRSDNVLQDERNLFKALKQFIERKDLAQKSYKTTSSMSDREYSIYKGLAPSDDCAIDWWCGTGHFKVILSPSNDLILPGGKAKVKRTVNKNRKHRITANPNLKAIGESRRFARRGR